MQGCREQCLVRGTTLWTCSHRRPVTGWPAWSLVSWRSGLHRWNRNGSSCGPWQAPDLVFAGKWVRHMQWSASAWLAEGGRSAGAMGVGSRAHSSWRAGGSGCWGLDVDPLWAPRIVQGELVGGGCVARRPGVLLDSDRLFLCFDVGGYYHGKLIFPREFPFKPPSIYMITPNGRFKCNTR